MTNEIEKRQTINEYNKSIAGIASSLCIDFMLEEHIRFLNILLIH